MAFICGAFWYQDWQYSLPTPRPEGLKQPPIGSILPVRVLLPLKFAEKPIFFHFFNPDCPCSRFNLEHVQSLVNAYGSRIRFVAVVQAPTSAKAREAFERLHLNTEFLADPEGEIGQSMGVYATPQAAIVTAEGKLYYRGNYNATRYCTDHQTEFARIALERLLRGEPSAKTPATTEIAYGCPLPRHKNTPSAR